MVVCVCVAILVRSFGQDSRTVGLRSRRKLERREAWLGFIGSSVVRLQSNFLSSMSSTRSAYNLGSHRRDGHFA